MGTRLEGGWRWVQRDQNDSTCVGVNDVIAKLVAEGEPHGTKR